MRGLWCAGAMEPGKAAARVPVLRLGGAVHRRRGDRCDRRARPRQGAARDSRPGSRLAGRKADRPVPELQGRLGLRPGARRTELRLLRLAGARRLSGDQGADPAAEPASVHRHGRQRPRADPQVVRQQVARAWQAQEPGPCRPRARCLHSLLDIRRAGRVPMGRRGWPLLLHDRDLSRRRTHAHAPGPARALGSGLRSDRALLRR